MKKIVILVAVVIILGLGFLLLNRNTENNPAVQEQANVTNEQSPQISNQAPDTWKAYSFPEAGISLSAPSDMTVTGDATDNASFILTIERSQYPAEDYYQLYGSYQFSSEKVDPKSLKTELDPNSISETKIDGFPAVSGQYKGERNRLVTYIITDRGLFTLATSQPTEPNKAQTTEILKTLKLQ